MGVYKRGATWWIAFTPPNGQRVRASAGTGDKRQAEEYLDRLKAEAWRSHRLGECPAYLWQEAVIRWLEESAHKKSIEKDKWHLRWAATHLDGFQVRAVSQEVIAALARERKAEGVSPATVNRMLEVIRAILTRAHKEWQWIDRVPVVRMLPVPKRRVRWITREEAARLIKEAPAHLAAMIRFALATGLREGNICQLQWSQVDLARRCAWIHADQAKAGKAIPVPLNQDALDVVLAQLGEHSRHVFTYQGRPVARANNHAWRKALRRAGIEDFRFHDLRHTFASWHIQAGTPLHVLQELGGWSNLASVLRYAHLGGERLAEHAERIVGTHLSQSRPRAVK